MFDTLRRAGARRVLLLDDPPSGLEAVLVIDSLALGPAAGGVRTLAYPDFESAVTDAARLARAMTQKCALAGLPAGGAKTVVRDHAGLDRPRAFRRLGAWVEELGGLYRTAGDLGTTAADLDAMAATTRWVDRRDAALAEAAGSGVVRCLAVLAEFHGAPGLPGLRVAVQGCGAMGAAVARELARAGAVLFLADLEEARARRLAAELGARVVAPDALLAADVDVIAPCAAGGVLTADTVAGLRAWGVCGAANNPIADHAADAALAARGTLYVPDIVASAGAVIAGLAPELLGITDITALLDGLAATARDILEASRRERRPTAILAAERARARVSAAEAHI